MQPPSRPEASSSAKVVLGIVVGLISFAAAFLGVRMLLGGDEAPVASSGSAADAATQQPAQEQMTEAAFARAVESRCRKDIKWFEKLPPPSSIEEYPTWLQTVIDRDLARYAYLRTLEPPPSMAADWAKVVRGFEKDEAFYKEHMNLALAGDVQGLQRSLQAAIRRTERTAIPLLRRLGLEGCIP